jgi:hypothetical protein
LKQVVRGCSYQRWLHNNCAVKPVALERRCDAIPEIDSSSSLPHNNIF